MTNFDKMVLDIWTDGTIQPDEALRQSADILVRHFTQLANYRATLTEPEKRPLSSMPIPQMLYDTPIWSLELSVRTYHCHNPHQLNQPRHTPSRTQKNRL